MNEPEIAVSFQDLEGSRVAFRRGCTAVPLQEGVTMFEYTVDWAINVSLNVQTVLFFFALLLSLSLSSLSRRSHFLIRVPSWREGHTQDHRELSEAFDWYLSG